MYSLAGDGCVVLAGLVMLVMCVVLL